VRSSSSTKPENSDGIDDAESNPESDEDNRLFALGKRSLADLIAPDSFEVRGDDIRLDGQYARVLAITGYPRLVTPGWLGVLSNRTCRSRLACTYDRWHRRTWCARCHSRWRACSHPVWRSCAVNASPILNERSRGRCGATPGTTPTGEERPFAVSVYLLLRAPTRKDLDVLTRRVEEQLDALLAHSRRTLWEQCPGFESCLPSARDSLLVARNLDTSAVAASLPFVGPSLAMESGMLFGIATQTQAPVILDPFDQSLDNANLVGVAPAGAGKSFMVKLLALRQLVNGVDCIIIDPEVSTVLLPMRWTAQIVRLAASSGHQLNPFDFPAVTSPHDVDGEEDVLAERVTALLGMLEVLLCSSTGSGASRGLDAHKRAVLDRALYQTYAAAGITRDAEAAWLPLDNASPELFAVALWARRWTVVRCHCAMGTGPSCG
jgi:conjugal transfer ATP-binding protein TraC